MNTLHSIRTRLLIVITLVLVVWATYGILTIVVLNSSQHFKAIQDDLIAYQREFTDLKTDILNFLENPHTAQFYESNENTELTGIKNRFFQLNDQLNDLFAKSGFVFLGDSKQALQHHKDELDNIKNKILELSQKIREKGNENSGLISEWIAMNYHLDNLGYNYNISDDITRLIGLQESYINHPEISPIDQITTSTDRLISDLRDAYELNDSIGYLNDLIASLENFSSLGNQILRFDSEIGFTVDGGLKSEILNLFSEQQDIIADSQKQITSKLTTSNHKGKQRIVILWYIFFFLIGGVFIYQYRDITIPFKLQREVFNDLEQGKIPERIDIQFRNEFDELFVKINNHFKALNEKAGFSKSLSEGKLDVTYTPVSNDDIIGNSLVNLKNHLVNARKEEEKLNIENERRRWTNEGVAMMAETLRLNNDNLEELSFNIIFNIVKYMKAAQGGLFLSHAYESGKIKSLDLKASFAFNRRKFIEKSFEPGEGLIGTCALEKKSILLKEIPDNYLEITSGLGESNPNCILIVPLKVDEDVQGVVEIASFNVFDDYEVEFIEKIAENIASTIISVKINERTSQLLKQSQIQAAEMTEKEEEMRQNMEELQATQEEAARRENEINSILNAINQTALVVEYDMDGLIININERFLELLDTPKNEVLGIHHSIFTSKNNAEKSYLEFWDQLNKGDTINSIEVIKLLNGKKLWLKQTYSPIFNLENRPYKVINIAQDISEIKIKEQSLEMQSQQLIKKDIEIETLNKAISESFIRVIMELDGTIIEANDNFALIAALPSEELNGRNFLELMNEDDRGQYEQIFQNILAQNSFRGVLKFTNSGGNEFWIMATFTAVKDEKGEIYKLFMLGQNITEQKLRYQLLSDANNEVEKLKKELKELKDSSN